MDEIRVMDPCDDCGSEGGNTVAMVIRYDGTGHPAVLCPDCREVRRARYQARREREMLADWGTIGQGRASA